MRLTPALALLAVLPAAAAAQTVPATLPAPRVGILAGLSSATIGFEDSEENDGVDRRNGLVGGVYVALPFARYLAFRPELLYVQKGASGGDSDDRSTLKLDYVEVPVLLEVTVPTAGRVRPQLYAGPALAFKARCQVAFEGDGVSASTGCSRVADEFGEDNFDVKSFDLGGVVGGALAFDVGGRAVTVGARYTHGFTQLIDDGGARNRAIGVYGSIEFPFGRARR